MLTSLEVRSITEWHLSTVTCQLLFRTQIITTKKGRMKLQVKFKLIILYASDQSLYCRESCFKLPFSLDSVLILIAVYLSCHLTYNGTAMQQLILLASSPSCELLITKMSSLIFKIRMSYTHNYISTASIKLGVHNYKVLCQ